MYIFDVLFVYLSIIIFFRKHSPSKISTSLAVKSRNTYTPRDFSAVAHTEAQIARCVVILLYIASNAIKKQVSPSFHSCFSAWRNIQILYLDLYARGMYRFAEAHFKATESNQVPVKTEAHSSFHTVIFRTFDGGRIDPPLYSVSLISLDDGCTKHFSSELAGCKFYV